VKLFNLKINFVLVAYEHDEDSSTITELNINVKKKKKEKQSRGLFQYLKTRNTQQLLTA